MGRTSRSTGEIGSDDDAGKSWGSTFVEGEWEYRPVHLPGDVSRVTAAVRLAVQAEFGGWELSRLRLYPGGVRKVLLRRRRSASSMLSEPTI